MEFKFRAVDDRPSPSMMSYFTEQALRGYSDNRVMLNELLSNPPGTREAIQRELEKERIREEIIAREIARRRILEAEVRRELFMEQELIRSRTELRPPVFPAMRLEGFPLFQQSDSRALEERLSRSLEQRIALQARQELLAALGTGTPLQRGVEAAVPEAKTIPEINKDRVILLPKPEQNLSGVKRKATTPPAVGGNDVISVGPRKKLKEEWSCALCQVSATCERGLNEHLQGKRHKAKEAWLVAQRAGKNPGPSRKKIRKDNWLAAITGAPCAVKVVKLVGEMHQADIVGEASIPILKKHNPETGEKKNDESLLQTNEVGEEMKKNGDATKPKGQKPVHQADIVGEASIPILKKHNPETGEKKNDESLLQTNEVGEEMKKNGDATKPKGQKPVDPKQKKKFKFWCELCHIGAYTCSVWSTHEKGKKHLARLEEAGQPGLPVPVSSTTTTPPSPEPTQNAETTELMAEQINAEVMAVEAQEKPIGK